MKQCPQCRITYTDESLRYCLADGSLLETLSASDEPTVFPPRTNQMRVPIHTTEQPQPTFQPPAAKSSYGRWIKIVLGLLALGILGLAVVAVAGVLIYYNSGSRETAVAVTSPAPPSPSSSTPDTEKQKLEDELANLQKRIEDQKKSAVNSNPFPPDTDSQPGSLSTATVNSPNDGFLALRSLPDAEYGQRVAKIPHGSKIEVVNCADDSVTIGGRAGHWCLVTYKSYAGFVFDAFLDY